MADARALHRGSRLKPETGRKMRKILFVIASVALVAVPRPAAAQNLLMGAAGGAAGVAAGGYVSLAVVVAEARAGRYLMGFEDFLGWRSTPVLVGGGTGLAIGLWEEDRLKHGVLWGTVGTGVGAGVGLLVGPMIWEGPEAKWAGGAIGAGLGMVAGSLIGLALDPNDDAEEDKQASAVQIPLLQLRF